MMGAINRQLAGRWQVAAYLALALAALICILVLLPTSDRHFRRFFGPLNPLLVLGVATVAGMVSLWALRSGYGFAILRGRSTLRGAALSLALATALAVAIVVADLFIRYPQDMNVPVPQALLFYPAVGFIAEIVFHVLPLALLLLVLSPLAGFLGRERIVWLGVLLVALLEPTFQILFERKALSWGAAYTWLHVFAIAGLQLVVFRRFDFVSMVAFRLFYYAYWHVLWGVIRLRVLF